jgi:sugar phosphate isomerase/epimerase
LRYYKVLTIRQVNDEVMTVRGSVAGMLTRRDFLTTAAAVPLLGLARPSISSAATEDIHTALNGPVGLQLWSLRTLLPGDLAGTLGKVRAMGFVEVEAAGLYKHTIAEFRQALDAAGLKCHSAHTGFGALRDHTADAFAEAKAFGATTVVCPWIDHGNAFTADDAAKAVDVFNRVGAAAKAEGLTLAYHCHGYEFVPAAQGTLFDTIANGTDPALVKFQIDVLHAYLGGGDPVALITKHGARVTSLHLKDLKKGFPVTAGRALAPADSDVPVGSGQVDMPAVLRAAVQAGVGMYYIEDESPDPLGHIPQSVAYLKSLTL